MSEFFIKYEDEINEFFNTSDYYKALQVIKTTVRRSKSPESKQENLDFLLKYMKKFVEAKEIESAVDLSKIFLEIIETSTAEDSLDKLGNLKSLVDLMIPDFEMWQHIRPRISEIPRKARNDEIFQKIERHLALSAIKAGFPEEARIHSYNINSSSALCTFMIEFSKRFIFNSEHDLFTLQFVLATIKKKGNPFAKSLFNQYMRRSVNLPHGHDFPFKLPAYNFIYLLIDSIEAKSKAKFCVLVELYKPTWSIDPSNKDIIDEIKQIHFPNRPTRNNSDSNSISRMLDAVTSMITRPMNLGSEAPSSTSLPNNTTSPSTQPPSNQANEDFMEID